MTKQTDKQKITEFLRYLVIGFSTTFINWGVSIILEELIGMPGWINTVISWIISVIFFAFWSYKFFVFRSRSMEKHILFTEFIGFVSARLLTLGVESLFIFVFVDWLGFNQIIRFSFTRLAEGKLAGSFYIDIKEFYIFKLFATVIITILNYIFSKLVIFKKGQKLSMEENSEEMQNDDNINSEL